MEIIAKKSHIYQTREARKRYRAEPGTGPECLLGTDPQAEAATAR